MDSAQRRKARRRNEARYFLSGAGVALDEKVRGADQTHNSGNWKNQFGSLKPSPTNPEVMVYDYAHPMTPKQGKRALKKNNRAAMLARHEGMSGLRYQRILLRTRRMEGKLRREQMRSAKAPVTKNYVGEGTKRAVERMKKLFGRDANKLFDERGKRVAYVDPKTNKRGLPEYKGTIRQRGERRKTKRHFLANLRGAVRGNKRDRAPKGQK